MKVLGHKPEKKGHGRSLVFLCLFDNFKSLKPSTSATTRLHTEPWKLRS